MSTSNTTLSSTCLRKVMIRTVSIVSRVSVVSMHLLEEGAVALGHDGDRAPGPPRTRGAPHAVDVGLHLSGEVAVDDLLRVRVRVRVRVGVRVRVKVRVRFKVRVRGRVRVRVRVRVRG